MRHESGEGAAGVVVMRVVMHVGFCGAVFGGDQFYGPPFRGRVVGVASLNYEVSVQG
jgi:hypothetical protein